MSSFIRESQRMYVMLVGMCICSCMCANVTINCYPISVANVANSRKILIHRKKCNSIQIYPVTVHMSDLNGLSQLCMYTQFRMVSKCFGPAIKVGCKISFT